MRERIACGALFALGLASCTPSGFRLIESGVSTDLRGLFVSSPERALVAGELGTVLLYDGAQVTNTSTDSTFGQIQVPNFYAAVTGDGADYVAGDAGLVLQLTEEGLSRVDAQTQGRRMLTGFRGEAGVIFAGEEGRAVQSGPERFERLQVGGSGGARLTGGQTTSDGVIALSADNGAVFEQRGDWLQQPVVTGTISEPLPLFDLWASGPDGDLVVVGLGGSIHRRPAGALSTPDAPLWSQEPTPGNQDLYGVFGVSEDRIWAVGAKGTILQWDGLAWTGITSGTSRDLFAIHGTTDGSLVVIVGANGTMLVLQE